MKTIVKKVFNMLYMIAIMMIAGIFQSCNNADDFAENEIANSSELEEYIIAAADFQQSLQTFVHEFGKVDLLSLKTKINSEGKEVIYFPASIGDIRIEEKIQIMNEKKEALFCKFPYITFMDLNKVKGYVNYSINNSIKVNDKLLEFGIKMHIPLLKPNGISEYFNNFLEFADYLAAWVTNPNYVEAYIIAYEDGTKEIYVDDRNDATNSYLPFSYNNGNPTRNGKAISYIAHTHLSGHTPGSLDLVGAKLYPLLKQGIYYNGSIEFYN
jgi:hypothetical protein